jgi:xylan 1,4-beta-xylosidase
MKMMSKHPNCASLSTAIAKGFVGSLYAMYVTSGGESSDNEAVYRWFGYNGNDSTY